MKQISNKFQQGTLTILIAGNAFKLEKVGPAFSIFNPCHPCHLLQQTTGNNFNA